MVRKAAKLLVVLAAISALLASVVGCGASSPTTSTAAKLDQLTLVAPPGPMAIPMAYIAANNELADVAKSTKVVIWENADQLKAILGARQGDFVTVPSNNAATFYNKGIKLRLLDISVWNITYLITSDLQASNFKDIKGQSLAVPFQGSVPDVMFQYLATKEGLNPTKDFALRYTTDPTEAAQLLVAGQVKNAVLSEPLSTAVLLQTKDRTTPLHRALSFDRAWAQATPTAAPIDAVLTPIAGVVATSTVMNRPHVIAAFEREYSAAVDWMLANPDAAGQLLETELPQLGVKAAVMTASLKNITWQHRTAQEAKPALEAFFTSLMTLSPAVIGGKLPDDAFYYTE